MKKKSYTYIVILLLAVVLFKPLQTEAASPRLVDNADLLSAEEEAELDQKLNEISEARACDVIIVTAESLEGKASDVYADDFYDENGYGKGETSDGILLLVCMEDRDWAISTCGYGITAFTDAGQEYMTERFLPYLSDGDYAEAFHEFADLCDDFILQADTGEPYDVGNLPEESTRGAIPFWIAASLLFSFLIALVIAMVRKSSLKTIVSNDTAQEYMKKNNLKFSINKDTFIGEHITKRHIERNTGSSGGSSTHTSSSGATHGGSKGKF